MIYEDSDWEIWIPKTYAASCKLGQGTTWCTASTESDHYYKSYKEEYGGEYYIIINKQDPAEKYQFHFESKQFMDRDDFDIDFADFELAAPGVIKYFESKGYFEVPQFVELDQDALNAMYNDDIWTPVLYTLAMKLNKKMPLGRVRKPFDSLCHQ